MATPLQTASIVAAVAEPGVTLQKPRASFSSTLAFAVSLSLFGSLGSLTGCGGRTGLLGLEDDAPVAGDTNPEPRDAGVDGDGGTHDAGPDVMPDAGMDAGVVNPAYVSDLDCDDIPDLLDNCFQSSNTNQSDVDHDGLGDVCDVDSLNNDFDGDGVLDGEEIGVLGSDATKTDTDGDGVDDGEDACPTTAGLASDQGCQPSPATCTLEVVPHPMTLCDGTFVEGFRILWSTGNASDAALKEGTTPLTRKRSGQIYAYPMTSTLYVLTAESPFGTCEQSVTVTP